MLSSVLDSLRAWPAVRRGALATLLPPGGGEVARVLDVKVARALRALGYSVSRGPGATRGAPALLAALRPARPGATHDDIESLRALVAELPPGGLLLLRAPLRERERLAAAFLHVGLTEVSQVALRRWVLTLGRKLAAPASQAPSR
jgi:hypothetical protein